VYEDLREVAHHALRRMSVPGSLDTTALVHEAYLNLHGQERTSWEGQSHVLGVAATAMRRILVNRSETSRCLKRGGAHVRVPLEEVDDRPLESDAELVEVDQALERLARMDLRKARLVELRFFAGLSLSESACALGVSLNTAKRDWTVAKLWILRDIEQSRA
jgi:RNA polymerase sigma factor (TIGR02999 family)